ncbi:histidine phosphatase family protein [Sphingobium sp. AN641]|uniref:histidine phosphatase family protein n=1 Tax=Sphingobium sp. AN641 TaxID=3133443 RepID=UPI0030C42DE9
MRRLFIVRHGNTFGPGEAPRRVGVRTDIPLVESGERQAAALGEWFAREGINFNRALSGPLIRTRQTAQAILNASAEPCDLGIADFLAEIDHGPDENAIEDDVIDRIGHDAIAAWDERAEAPDGWQVDREGRIAAWRAFLADVVPGNSLLVTSNGAARFALLATQALAEQARRTGRNLKLRTGAYGEIEQRGPDDFTIVSWDERPK